MKKVELVFDRLSVDWTPEEDEALRLALDATGKTE